MVENDFTRFEIQEDTDFSQGIPSLKEITLLHIRKISAICCNELSKGYWQERPIKVGGGITIMKTYHPDQRAIFCNSVDFLLWIVLPTADETFKTKYKDLKSDNSDQWEGKLDERKEIFKEINLMFERTNYFDSMTGKTERGK